MSPHAWLACYQSREMVSWRDWAEEARSLLSVSLQVGLTQVCQGLYGTSRRMAAPARPVVALTEATSQSCHSVQLT